MGDPKLADPAQLLREFQVGEHSGLLAIGSFDRKTSLYYQQVRALNLIWLLSATKRLEQDLRIGILGGGIAGVTAAAALLAKGFSPVLLEGGPELLALQRHSHQRRIHPHLYAWPEPDAENPHANLPLLDWQAGISAEVAEQWLNEFARLCQNGNCNILCHARATALEAVNGGYELSWQQGEKQNQTSFDLLILALGVGIERSIPGLPLHSYWQDDGLQQSGGQVLISGCGEGGVLEVLRLKLENFDPEELVQGLHQDAGLRRRLLDWDKQAQMAGDQADFLSRHYALLDLPELDARLEQKLNPRIELTLHGPHPSSPLNLQATPLNRLLLSRLQAIGALKYSGGSKLLAAAAVDGRLEACFSDGQKRLYDAILVRHGASSALRKSFASLWEQALQPRTGTSSELLTPLWPRAFYTV